MILHAKFFAPIWLSTSSLLEMAFFWMNNAGITLGEPLKTREAVALAKTFV
jgi:hypothetical protein